MNLSRILSQIHVIDPRNYYLAILHVNKICDTLKCFVSSQSSSGLFEILNTMPKDNAVAMELRRIRKTVRANALKKTHAPPSEVYLSVIGNGSKGTPRCLCVFTDHRRYIFNCGEGSQRLAYEHKAKLAKIHDIFFTYKSWENLGGLPGLSLTLQDVGVPEITLHGPRNIDRLYPMTKHFLLTKDIDINFRPYSDGTFEDSCFNVQPISLTSSSAKSVPGSPGGKRIRLSEEAVEDVAVAYVCKLNPKPGQLLLEKCVDLGVPCGPLLGELKNGKDITLENGTVVKASDVVSPPLPGHGFIVVECPNDSFLDSLSCSEELRKHQNEDSCAIIVVHFTPASVVKHPKYQEWISRFPSKTSHLYLNSEDLQLSLVGVHRLQYKLSLLDSSIFPVLPKPVDVVNEDPSQNVPAECSTRFYLRPNVGLDRTSIAQLQYEEYNKELQVIPEFDAMLETLHNDLHTIDAEDTAHPEYPVIVFLGTGSSIPSKTRNVSAIVVEISTSSCILMDCGEGTYGQLVRFYGIKESAAILTRLKTIFISHLHADHHMGLIQVLLKRAEALSIAGMPVEPVNLIAPGFLRDYLTGYNKVFEPIIHLVNLISCQSLEFKDKALVGPEYQQLLETAQIKELDTVYVRHCKNAYGLLFTTNCGIKLVYSGDTMPCDRLATAGQDCTILIHEATMEDQLYKDATSKAHSTTSQAITMGRRMKAKFIILTHFSQRYAKVPLINNNFDNTVGVAFDNMRVQLSDLPKLPLLIPVMKCMFHEDYCAMEERTAKKLLEDEIIMVEKGLRFQDPETTLARERSSDLIL